MRIGYARVSTTAQNLDMQIEALNKAGCEKIYTEKESGVKERPVLKELLSFIRQGDTLVVYKLDRLGRSVRELLAMVDDLREKGISLIALQDNIDATTPSGKMMLQMMAILAEYERNLIIERCQTGRKVAMAAGKKMGRPQEPHNSKADAAAAMYKAHMPIAQIMESLGVKSNRTIYKYLQQKGVKANRK